VGKAFPLIFFQWEISCGISLAAAEERELSVVGQALDRDKSGRLFVIDHTVREIAALGEYTASAGRFRLVFRREVFVFSPALGVYIDGLGAAIAVTLRWVGDVSTHSLIPESFSS
jgi:hypothetical protein